MSSNSFEKNLSLANAILLNVNQFKFFGLLSYKLPKVSIKENPSKPQQAVAFTDGKAIYINPDKCTEPKHYVSIIIHELFHVIHGHCDPWRNQVKRNQYIWNIALDHCINRFVLELCKQRPDLCEFPCPGVFFEDVHATDPDITPEELYDKLVKNLKEQPGGGFKGKIPEGSTIDINADGSGTITTPDGQKIIVFPDFEEGQDGVSPEEMMNTARAAWNSDMMKDAKGSMPGSILRELDAAFKFKVDWRKLLEDAVMTALTRSEERVWTRRNIFIPNMVLPYVQDEPGKAVIVVAVDVSGSIGDAELKDAIAIIMSALTSERISRIMVIAHDTHVTFETEIRDTDSHDEVIAKCRQIKGGGGTSHTDVFRWTLENAVSPDSDETVCALFSVTDMYSDIEHCHDHFGPQLTFPVTYLTSGMCPDLSVYGAKVIPIEELKGSII